MIRQIHGLINQFISFWKRILFLLILEKIRCADSSSSSFTDKIHNILAKHTCITLVSSVELWIHFSVKEMVQHWDTACLCEKQNLRSLFKMSLELITLANKACMPYAGFI